MTATYFNGRSDIARRLTIFAGRAVLGLGLSIVMSMTGLVIAWGLFIFSSASDRSIFMIMSMVGGGAGAGIGPWISWMSMDRQRRFTVILILLLCVAGGIGGGLAGYQFGANREFDCCAEPRTTPFTYTAFGATIGANAAMYLITASTAAARMVRGRRGPIPERP